jgi:hypothetical protein
MSDWKSDMDRKLEDLHEAQETRESARRAAEQRQLADNERASLGGGPSIFTRLSDFVNSLRRQESLWQIPLERDSLMARIDRLSHQHINEDICISNVDSHATEYISALKALLCSAVSEIFVFTDQLDETLADGTPLYSDPTIINIVKNFLSKPGRHVIILTRRTITAEFVADHPLFSELIYLHGFQVYCAGSSQRVQKCESKCVVVDKKAYNFRLKRTAWINFNNPLFAQKLSLAIERALLFRTTYLFDMKLLAPTT